MGQVGNSLVEILRCDYNSIDFYVISGGNMCSHIMANLNKTYSVVPDQRPVAKGQICVVTTVS